MADYIPTDEAALVVWSNDHAAGVNMNVPRRGSDTNLLRRLRKMESDPERAARCEFRRA